MKNSTAVSAILATFAKQLRLFPQRTLAFTVFAITACLIYSNSVHVPFIFDDYYSIVDNPHIRLKEFNFRQIIDGMSARCWHRPFSMLSFMLNYYFGGYEVAGYHIVNIGIHLAACIVFYLLSKTTLDLSITETGRLPVAPGFPGSISWTRKRASKSSTIAFFIAVLWLVHPLHTQTVTYVVQRMNSMAALFYILALLLYVHGRISLRRHHTGGGYSVQTHSTCDRPTNHKNAPALRLAYLYFTGSIISGIIAIGSKENSATLPMIIFLYEWYFFQNLDWLWLKKSLGLLTGLLLLLGIIAWIHLGPDPLERINSITDYSKQKFTFSERIITQPRVVLYYLSLLFYPDPSRLNLIHDFPLSHSLLAPWSTLFSIIVILGLLILAVILARRERLLSFCIIWFFSTLIIESSIIPLAIIYEHRTYLPSMFVVALVVCIISRAPVPKWLTASGLVAIALLLGLWTFERNAVWNNPITFWQDCIKKSPNKERLHINLGLYLDKQGKTQEAIPYFKRALQIEPDSREACNNMGIALAKTGNYADAAVHLHKALIAGPSWEIHNNLAKCKVKLGRISEALDQFSKARMLNPADAMMNHLFGDELVMSNYFDEAAVYYFKALEINPNLAVSHKNLGNVMLKKGRFKESLSHYYQASRLNPNDSGIQRNISIAQQIKEKLNVSLAALQQELTRHPGDADIHLKIGDTFKKYGDMDRAIHHYQQALAFRPGFIRALNGMVSACLTSREYDQAIDALKNLMILQPGNSTIHYNIACLHAKNNNIHKSVKWLRQAIEKGYDNWELIRSDKDLDNIRQSELYAELMGIH